MFEPVIGLEIHLAVKTDSKLFCGCRNETFGLPPNHSVCEVCLGLPGSLPTINEQAVAKAIMFSLALHCEVPRTTQFHRKNYFYPDAPKNYQISQYDRPIGEGGYVELPEEQRIGIIRCHLEEDAGRLAHPPYADYSLVDYNRSGAPLIEMVTAPDINGPEQARDFLARIRAIAQALGVSDANPEQGKMRADVNVSVRRPGAEMGVKVEVKNLNSFKSVQRSLEFEIRRQSRILAEGGRVTQETRGWDEGGQKTYTMRSKEAEADYRYFPEPDLPPISITEKWLDEIRAATPELPAAKEARYLALGLRPYDARILAYEVSVARFFDEALEKYAGDPQALANWLNSDVAGIVKETDGGLEGSQLTPERFVDLVSMVDGGEISGRSAKEILPDVVAGQDPREIVAARGLAQVSDRAAIERLVDEVMAANEKIARQAAENPKAVNALVGRVMGASRGKAKPDLVRQLIDEKLGAMKREQQA